MKCNTRSLVLSYLFRPRDLLLLITTIIAVFKHLFRYASSSSSGLRPSQRRSESELPPPPPPEEIAAGVPPARASAMANIFERREGLASWSSIVSNVDFKPSLFSISVLTSFRNWVQFPVVRQHIALGCFDLPDCIISV